MMHYKQFKCTKVGSCKLFTAAMIGSLMLVVLTEVYRMCFVFENECEMTYMYMKPCYISIELPEDIRVKYPQYELFVYGEGVYASDLKDGVLQGVPVLYIPGNGGSYKQVRSPASIALLMQPQEYATQRMFNFFTVSFDEELSGLYGGVLQRQTEFVAFCIRHILSLYKNMVHPPTTVPLLGHSMGGVISRALFTLPSFPAESVRLIITLSSPHARPILPLDTLMEEFYSLVDKAWEEGNTSHVTVVSMSSGRNDVQVLSSTTSVDAPNAINIPSHSVPRVWASTDHHEIVWCRRLQMALSRSLFQLQNGTTHELVKNQSIIQRTFCRNFLNPCSEFPPSPSPFPSRRLRHLATAVYVSEGHSEHRLTRHLSFNTSRSFQWLILSNVVTLMDSKWILACTFTQHCIDLSSHATSLPPIYHSKNKMIIIDTRVELYQQVILLEPPTGQKYHLVVEPFHRVNLTIALPVLSVEYDLLPQNHLILLPMDSSHPSTIVQHFKISLLCKCLDVSSLDVVIAGFYPQGLLKYSNLTSSTGGGPYYGEIQLSWLPEKENKSLLIQIPSLECKVKVWISLDIKETILQFTLHNIVQMLKLTSTLLLLQILWPTTLTTFPLSGLALGSSIVTTCVISAVTLDFSLCIVYCGVVVLYELMTNTLCLLQPYIIKLSSGFTCRISNNRRFGNMRTFSGVAVACLLLSSCHCGGVKLLFTLVASVLVMDSLDNPGTTSILLGGLWGVLLALPTMVTWTKLWINQVAWYPPELPQDPHWLSASVASVLILATVLDFKKTWKQLDHSKDTEKTRRLLMSCRVEVAIFSSILKTAVALTCCPFLQVSHYLLLYCTVLYINLLLSEQ